MHKYPSWVLKEMNEEIDDVVITDSNADLLMSVTPRASIASRGKWIFSRSISFLKIFDINYAYSSFSTSSYESSGYG